MLFGPTPPPATMFESDEVNSSVSEYEEALIKEVEEIEILELYDIYFQLG